MFDIPEGDCDCDGNQEDVLGVCGGNCAEDVDADGICDDVDDCVGALDACGICNGPGEIYECGCADIPEGNCDCDGNQLDAIGGMVEIAQRMLTPMASATMWTLVSAARRTVAPTTTKTDFATLKKLWVVHSQEPRTTIQPPRWTMAHASKLARET